MPPLGACGMRRAKERKVPILVSATELGKRKSILITVSCSICSPLIVSLHLDQLEVAKYMPMPRVKSC